jgi:hypothetical protein
MKKLYFLTFCLLLFFSANSQIVNIPDAQLKSVLINSSAANETASVNTPTYDSISEQWYATSYQPIDTNGDGEIQLAEAQAVKFLKITNITCFNTIGLDEFTNLQYLNFSGNFPVQNLDFTALVNLKALICTSNSDVTNLNASGLTNLVELNCSDNDLTVLNSTGTSNLVRLNCSHNELTNINVAQSPNLQVLYCSNNELTNINITQNPSLKSLDCFGKPNQQFECFQ